MVCTFFGHRDAPESIRPRLHNTLVKLIEDGADVFYVGHQGKFDAMVKRELKALSVMYPHIRYTVVQAYMPGKRKEREEFDDADTLYPEGLETVPQKFAIDKRNRLMIE